MERRAVSARDLLAPLAVLVPILATLAGTYGAISTWPPAALVVIAAGLAATALAGRRRYGLRVSLAAGVATLLTSAVALWLWAIFGPYLSICGKDIAPGWVWIPLAGGALAFLAVGSWGLRFYRVWLVPLGLLVGTGVTLLLAAAVPGAPGYCET